MWTLKRNVTILIRKEGIRINRAALEANQDLALLVMNNDEYREKWGHNFEQVEGTRLRDRQKSTVRPDEVIEVNVKKKSDVVSPTLQESALISKEASSDGMNLNVSDIGQQSQSDALKQSKQGKGNQSSQGRK